MDLREFFVGSARQWLVGAALTVLLCSIVLARIDLSVTENDTLISEVVSVVDEARVALAAGNSTPEWERIRTDAQSRMKATAARLKELTDRYPNRSRWFEFEKASYTTRSHLLLVIYQMQGLLNRPQPVLADLGPIEKDLESIQGGSIHRSEEAGRGKRKEKRAKNITTEAEDVDYIFVAVSAIDVCLILGGLLFVYSKWRR